MAEVGNKFGLGAGGGQFGGIRSPKKATGRYFIPPHMMIEPSGTTTNTVAARYYITPFYVEQPTTYAGAWMYNSGTGDNGDKVKIAIYSEATAGGPGTLAKNFGEVTLTGASAVRTFAASWSANPGWYYLEMVTDNIVSVYCMSTYVTTSNMMIAATLGSIGPQTISVASAGNFVVGDYVAGTYANFPEATSLTPTTTRDSSASQFPLFGLYT